MSNPNGITQATPSRIPFGAGFFFHGVPYSEKVAPTLEAMKAGLMGATQEGSSLNITPEFFTPPLDGALVAIKELQRKVGEVAEMEVNFAELTSALIAWMAIAKVSDSEDGNYDVITSSDLTAGHFIEGFGFYGEHMDGRPMIVLFKNALCTSGFPMENKNKTNSVLKGTFACQSDIEYGTTKLPYAIFIRKEEGWVAVEPEEVAAA